MSGIYIHIPFCEKKCNYCNFYSLASVKHKSEIVDAILTELTQRKNYLPEKTIETIYLGGGTPSILNIMELDAIINTIYKHYSISTSPEITIEANPHHLSINNLNDFKNLGINRLSIGIQSFNDEDLEFLARNHTATQAEEAIKNAQHTEFKNLSIDLIYGIPTLSKTSWLYNLEKTFHFQIPHISAYSLTVEEKTPLHVGIQKGKFKKLNEDEVLEQYETLLSEMKIKGYEHYEISNFAQSGMYAKHNTAYWQGKPYLGIGPSAHSYDGNSRQWNIANLGQYINSTKKGGTSCEKEILTNATRFNEYIMTSLRTQWGCSLTHIQKNIGEGFAKKLLEQAQPFVQSQNMIIKNQHLILTEKGKLFADNISASLFVDDPYIIT